MELTFDPTSHQYFLDGRKILNVTKILRLCGVIDDRFYNEEARIRGTIVHKCCHYLAENDLDWNTVDPALIGYIKAYLKFLTDSGFVPNECEKKIYHPTLYYACTPDQIGDGGRDQIIELKTGHMPKWTGLQLALQAMARFPERYYEIARVGVELHEDETYRHENFNDEQDFDVAMGMVSIANWRLKNNDVKEK